MSANETRDEWLAKKVAQARASVAAGRVFSHEEANRMMDRHIAEIEERQRSKAA